MIGGLLREGRGPAVVDAAAEATELLYAVAMLAERLNASVTGQTWKIKSVNGSLHYLEETGGLRL